jgi:hypothetical protein
MPLTFFAHQAFVLPLKWAFPRRFDGTALCVGSMAPDLAYALVGTPLAFPSHALSAQLGWSLPVAVALTLGWRHQVSRPLGDWLGGRTGEQIRALSRACRPLLQTASSALLGALSHVFVDGFTHPGGWATEHIGLLRQVLVEGVTVAKALQYTGHVLGSAAGLGMMVVLVRSGQLSAWSGGTVEPQPPSPSFRSLALLGCALAIPAAWSALQTGGGLPVALTRATWTVFAGLALASLARARRSPDR